MKPECAHGYPRGQIEMLLREKLEHFDRWMDGQTQMICEGRSFNHDTREYEPNQCADTPHGIVTYSWDFDRYVSRYGLPNPPRTAITDAQCTLSDLHLSYTPRAVVMEELLSQDRELLQEIITYGAKDTAVRGRLLEAYSVMLTGAAWPAYGGEWTDEKLEEFEASLRFADEDWKLT